MIKAIITTLVGACMVFSLVLSIFLNSILGMFGLITTTIDQLDALQSSQSVLNKMRERHQQKKAQLSKRFVKKTGKKASSMAMASVITVPVATTTAVVLTFTGLEVADYCEQREALHIDEMILLGGNEPFDMGTCMQEVKQEAEQISEQAMEMATAQMKEGWQYSQQYGEAVWQSLLEWKDKASQANNDFWQPFFVWALE